MVTKILAQMLLLVAILLNPARVIAEESTVPMVDFVIQMYAIALLAMKENCAKQNPGLKS